MIKGFQTHDNITTFVTFNDGKISEKLKPMVYVLTQHPMSGEYMLQHDKEKFPLGKLYGNTPVRATKILNTFESREKATGVLLDGVKGSGKTALMEHTANLAIEKGYPVIIINNAFAGDSFATFLANIGEAIILFDEYGKVYGKDSSAQDRLLTILDGTMSSKKLFIFTENDSRLVNAFMINRPGRIFYHYSYSKLGEDIIKEILKDAGVPEDKANEILLYSRQVETFSHDILKAIIDEITRYPEESVESLINDLNVESLRYVQYLKILKMDYIDSSTDGIDKNTLVAPEYITYGEKVTEHTYVRYRYLDLSDVITKLNKTINDTEKVKEYLEELKCIFNLSKYNDREEKLRTLPEKVQNVYHQYMYTDSLHVRLSDTVYKEDNKVLLRTSEVFVEVEVLKKEVAKYKF